MRSRAISRINALKVFDDATRKSYYGCDQEWYATEWQRLSGCGPTAVCNIIWYLSHIHPDLELNLNCVSKEASLSFLEELWGFVTPTANGIPTTKMLCESVMGYTQAKRLGLNCRALDIPEEKSRRPPFMDMVRFLEDGLGQDSPIAFLNLCNGGEVNLEPWHWVTIIALNCMDDGTRATIDILDEGRVQRIDLRLWYDSTVLGGGFIFFHAAGNDTEISGNSGLGAHRTSG